MRDKVLGRTHSSKEPWSFSTLSSGELEPAHTHLWKTYIKFSGILQVYWCHIGSLISAIVGILKHKKLAHMMNQNIVPLHRPKS